MRNQEISCGAPNDEKLAPLFETFPSQDAPAADFAQALNMVDAAAELGALQALCLLWPLWRRVNHLHIAERALRLCAEDLCWAYGVDAIPIAHRCAESLVAFPELELAIDRAALAQALALHGVGAAALHFEMLAHILAPNAPDILERLILRLAREGVWSGVVQALPTRFALGNSDIFVTRLAGAIDTADDDPAILDVTTLLADHLIQQRSLAAQCIGQILGDRLSEGSGNRADPLRLAETVTNARRMLRARLQGGRMPSDAPRLHDASFLRAYDLLATWRQTRSDPEPTKAHKDAGGALSWSAHQLTFGRLRIGVAQLSTAYAANRDNMLSAIQHRLGEAFQFGPYITLIPGLYKITYLGEASPSMAYELRMTSDLGTRFLGSITSVPREALSVPQSLGVLMVSLYKVESTVEFAIYSHSALGELISRGVEISRGSLPGG